MTLASLCLAGQAFLPVPAYAGECILLPAGAEWSYLDGGAVAPPGWQDPGFNDGSWPLGNAHFGYGELDEETELSFGGVATNKATTYYFRTVFPVADLLPFDQLDVNIVADDGCIVYLDGVEVVRDNMPTGAVDATTFAASSRSSPTENDQVFYTIPITSISTGDVVIAVEVHQRSLTSSDLSFDLEVVGNSKVVRADLLLAGSAWRYLDGGAVPQPGWDDPGFDDSGWATGNAELGYGDGDEATVLDFGGVATNKAITYYFRAPFIAPDLAPYDRLEVNLVADDGAIVYFNGVEALRDNMPAGPIGPDTEAVNTANAPEENLPIRSFAPISSISAGTNMVAVEVHQASSASTDLSFDLELVAKGPVTNIIVARGPYLQLPGPNSMTVCWKTSLPADSRVRFGTAADALAQSVIDTNLVVDHAVTVTGLQAATPYYYAVGTTTEDLAGGDEEHVFETPPLPGSVVTTRIWVIGSCGTGDVRAENVKQAFDLLNGDEYADIFLTLGDQAIHGATEADFQCSFFDVYSSRLRQTPVWPVLGNLDNDFREGLPYFSMFRLPAAGEGGGIASSTEKYYSFDHANIHFICLDSVDSPRTNGSPMLTWLTADLAVATQQWLIAYFHYGPYTKGDSDSDDDDRAIEMRENVLPILEGGGVDLVLSAQSHDYERSKLIDGFYATPTLATSGTFVDSTDGDPLGSGPYQKSAGPNAGTVYAVVGSSGKARPGLLNHPVMNTSLEVRGSLVVDVSGSILNARFVTDSNTVADTFTIVKGPIAPFDEWRLQHLGGVPPTVPLSGEGDDFEGDGVGNLMEYASGRLPTQTETNALYHVQTTGSEFAIEYTRDSTRTDVILEVDATRSLPAGDWSTSEVIDSLISSNGVLETRHGSIAAGIQPQGFLRLRATRP